MAQLADRLNSLAAAIGADIKALNTAKGDLTALSTTAKSNLVAALNEVYTMAQAGGSVIDDTAASTITTKTYSASQISNLILTAINGLHTELTDGASAALNTFGKLATALAADETGASALASAIGNAVKYDAAQTLTADQKTQARDNIGAADHQVASNLQFQVMNLQMATGNLDQDLVAVYTTAKT